MKNKYIRFLLILNGTLLPIILLYILFDITKDLLYPKERYTEQDYGVIVGDDLEEAKKNEYALQGLKYGSFNKIYNSTNSYLEISSMTYEERKNYKKYAGSSNDYRAGNKINIVFVDKDYKVINTLLNEKACITGMNIQDENRAKYRNTTEIDPSVKYIVYSIAFEDTNKDHMINSYDNSDLYISDLEGNNLKKITDGIYVDHYEFINANSRILIHYKERKDIPEEHKEVQFAIYDIVNKEFKKLNSLNDELKRLENLIIN